MAADLKQLEKRRYLLCLNTAIIPRKTEILKDKFIVGSKEDSDLLVPSDSVMEAHAIIRLSGQCCYIQIISPKGVTCVNKDQLIADERRALRSQDTIVFGDVRYRYVEGISN